PSYIRTIPKRGYSLIAEVKREHVQEDAGTGSEESAPISLTHLSDTKVQVKALLDKRVLAGVAALLILLSVLLWPSRNVVSDKDEVIRLAVLPVVNRELDTSNQFLTDGLRESLVNGLSKLSHMEVISPSRGYEDFDIAPRSDRIADRARD